ncbi:MAG: lipocalin-like domain-containing protein [Promethearchaeota archaeon]
MKKENVRDKFVGAWKLIAYEIRTIDGQVLEKNELTGILIYSKEGYMSVQMMKPERPKFQDGTGEDLDGESIEVIKAAFEGYGGYFGKYTLDEENGIITHHILGSHIPNWVSMDFERLYRFLGNKLELTSRPFQSDDKRVFYYLLWERFK